MNADRPNPSNPAQDSDDLIAELARLVAQDARTTSVKSDSYARTEPSFAPEPPQQDEPQVFETPEAAQWAEDEHFAPNDGESEAFVPPPAEHDGFEPSAEGPGEPYSPVEPQPAEDFDPIAGLIADAEVETYERDTREEDWLGEDEVEASPEPQQAASPAEGYDDRQFAVYHDPQPEQQPDTFSGQHNDPLTDIEALIGEAARNNDSLMSGRRVKSSFLDDEPTSSAVDAAESAILAAAAATGGSVRHNQPISEPERYEPTHDFEPAPEVEDAAAYEAIPDPLFVSAESPAAREQREYDEYAEDEGYAEEAAEPRMGQLRRRFGGFVIPVAAGVAILALLGGTYFVFFSGPQAPSEAPVLTADASPIKEEGAPPEDTGNASVVFNEIEGNTAAVEDEALLSRDQTGGATGRDVANVVGVEEGEMALANRPVRTVTVRPDGTIVPAEDSVAGSNVLPVDRPDVPAVPNSTLTSDPIGAAIAEAMAGESTTTETAAPETLALVDTGETTETAGAGSDANTVETAAPEAATVGGPTPIARPSNLSAATATTQTASAPPAATSTPAAVASADAAGQSAPAPAASGTVGAWVQLASQRTEADAQADIAPLQSRFGSLFNGATPEVSRVDLGERGIYYRVRLPQPTFAQANSVCSNIQAQGGDCFVMNN